LLREIREKSILERPRCGWEENTQRILENEGETNSLYWIHLVQDRDRWQGVVNPAMKLRVS